MYSWFTWVSLIDGTPARASSWNLDCPSLFSFTIGFSSLAARVWRISKVKSASLKVCWPVVVVWSKSYSIFLALYMLETCVRSWYKKRLQTYLLISQCICLLEQSAALTLTHRSLLLNTAVRCWVLGGFGTCEWEVLLVREYIMLQLAVLPFWFCLGCLSCYSLLFALLQ